MDLELNSSNIKQYNVLNHDIEICGKYFDVVPDGNLFTLDDMPIFAVRMRPMGILHIMNSYNKKYNIDTKVLTYKLNTNQYTLYSSDSRAMYETQKEALLKFFDFSQCKNNEFKGIIVVITNNDDRMIHAIPYLYGCFEGKKKIIFLDPYYELNIFSGCVVGADFFYQNIKGVECYCHGETIQADHHSCGIIACDFVKNCLQNNAKLTKKILNNVIMRVEVESLHNNSISYVNSFDLPIELKKFAQVHIKKQYENSINETSLPQERERRHNWFLSHMRTLIYRKDPEPYNPDGEIVPESEGIKKEINTALLEKGHKYAGKIIKELKQNIDYNSKYWLDLIKEQKDGNIIRKLMIRARKMIKKDTQKNQETLF